MFENRRHFRLREHLDVSWKVKGQPALGNAPDHFKEDSGEGMVLNISSSGLLLQTDKVFRPFDHCVLSIEPPVGGELPFASRQGRMMWFRRVHSPRECYQCGLQFSDDKNDKSFQQWFDSRVSQMSEASNLNILSNLSV